MSASTAASGDFLMKLRNSVERAAQGQLARHVKAGNPISRAKAISIAVEQHQQILIQLGEKLESEGSDGSTDTFREVADLLPAVIREIGPK